MATIAIIGSGRMGGAFGKALTGAGHSVIYGSRDPAKAELVELVGGLSDNASSASIGEAAASADMVLLAMPYAALGEVLPSLGDMSGKIVIDVTNALGMGGHGLMQMISDTSSAQEIAAALPGARIVKAFNTIGYFVIAKPDAMGGPVTCMLASDDAEAKAEVAAIAKALGFTTADVGPLVQARYLEGMSALYITPYLQGRMGDAFEFFCRTAGAREGVTVRAAG